MRKSLLIGGGAIAVIAIVITAIVLSGVIKQEEELVLSNYPKLFEKDVLIVVGENATQIEYESAEAIAANLENLTGNKPKIYISEKSESLKYTYNLVILGTPNSNEVLKEVYKMTDVTRVTDEYPGEGKGVLEILKNPWDEDKAMLLVAGSDEWGVKAGSEVLEQPQELNESHIVVEWKESGSVIVEEPPSGQVMSAGKHYPSDPFRVEKYNVSEVIEKAKSANYWIRYGSVGGPYTYYNGSESKKLYAYKEEYVSITRSEKEYWFTIGPANPADPTNYELIAMLAPQKNIPIDVAGEIVENELTEIGINLRYSEKIEWDLNMGFVPPVLFRQGQDYQKKEEFE